MKFADPNCPECGDRAIATVEKLVGYALLEEADLNGDTEYTGETKVDWNSQETDSDPETGDVYLVCNRNHQWTSKVLEK